MPFSLRQDRGGSVDRTGGGEGGEGKVLALKAALDRHGIDLIVEKVESEKTLVELLDFQIDFGQGYLFGEPRVSKD
ncbi:MAG: EAL domain-containing protein [Rhodospirillaceae bacterium]|nr:EAL domain-containing protein [Rhodospirillaceae bacterium]